MFLVLLVSGLNLFSIFDLGQILTWILIWDSDINMGFVLKSRPYGGLIVIDKMLLVKHLKHFKFLRLHAMLHDAAGYL